MANARQEAQDIGEAFRRAGEVYSDGRLLITYKGAHSKLYLEPDELIPPAKRLIREVKAGIKEASPHAEVVHDVTADHEITRIPFVREGIQYEIYHGYLTNRETGNRDRETAGVSKTGGQPSVIKDGEIVELGDRFVERADIDLVTKRGKGFRKVIKQRRAYIQHGASSTDGLDGVAPLPSRFNVDGAKSFVKEVFNALQTPPATNSAAPQR